jgi:hypothetical protein
MVESAEVLDTFMGRQTQQQRLGLGIAGDGSSGVNLAAAPAYVMRAILRGEGDKIVKLDPRAGLVVAPGVLGEVKIRTQVSMRKFGIELSYAMVENIVRMAYHQLPISGLQCKGTTACRIGEFTAKTNQPIDVELAELGGVGSAILEFFDNL